MAKGLFDLFEANNASQGNNSDSSIDMSKLSETIEKQIESSLAKLFPEFANNNAKSQENADNDDEKKDDENGDNENNENNQD